MPEIFEKGCKINVIEYSDQCTATCSFTDIKDSFFQTIRNFLQR